MGATIDRFKTNSCCSRCKLAACISTDVADSSLNHRRTRYFRAREQRQIHHTFRTTYRVTKQLRTSSHAPRRPRAWLFRKARLVGSHRLSRYSVHRCESGYGNGHIIRASRPRDPTTERPAPAIHPKHMHETGLEGCARHSTPQSRRSPSHFGRVRAVHPLALQQ